MANKREQVSIDAFLRLFLDNKAQDIKINFTFPTQSLDNFFKQTTKHFNEVNDVVSKLANKIYNINEYLTQTIQKVETISKIKLPNKLEESLDFLQNLYVSLRDFENLNVNKIKTNINEIKETISNFINTFTTFGIVNFDDKKLRAKLTISFNYFRKFINEFSKAILSDIAKINQEGIKIDKINHITLISRVVDLIYEALEKISNRGIELNEAINKLRNIFDNLSQLVSFTISSQGLSNMKLIIENFSNFIATLNSIKEIPLGTGAYINYFKQIFDIIKVFNYDNLEKFSEVVKNLKLKTTTDYQEFVVAFETFTNNLLNFVNSFLDIFKKFTIIKKTPTIPLEVFDYFKNLFIKVSEIIDVIAQNKIKILIQLNVKPHEYGNFRNFLYETLTDFDKTFYIINAYFTKKPFELKPDVITEYLKTFATLLQNTKEYFSVISKVMEELNTNIPVLNTEKIRNFLYSLKITSSVLLESFSKELNINLAEITIKLVRLAEVLNEGQGIFKVIINSMNDIFSSLDDLNYNQIRNFLYTLNYISTYLFTKLSEIKPLNSELVLNNLSQINTILQNVSEIFKNIILSIKTIFRVEIPKLNPEKIKDLLYVLRVLSSILFAKLSEIKPLDTNLILNNLNQINSVLVNSQEIFKKIKDNLTTFLNNIPEVEEKLQQKIQNFQQLIKTINEIKRVPPEVLPQSTQNSLSYLLRTLDVYRDFLVNVKDFNDKFVNLNFNTLENFDEFLEKVFTPEQKERFLDIFDALKISNIKDILTNFENEIKTIFGDLSEIILNNSTEFQEFFRVSLSDFINKATQEEVIALKEDFKKYKDELIQASQELISILNLPVNITNIEEFQKAIRMIFGNLDEYLSKLSEQEKARLQVIFNNLANYVKKLEELNDKIKLEISSLEKNKGLDFLNTKLAEIDKIIQSASWKLFQFSWSFIYIDIYAHKIIDTLEKTGNKILAITKNLNFLFLRMVGINKLITENTIYTQNEFKKLIEISVKTPYSLENVIDAYTQLKALGIDNIELLKKIIDTATSFGIEEVKSIADDIARAIQGDTTAFKNLRHSIGLTNITIKELGGRIDSSGRLINRTFGDVKANAEAMLKYLDKFSGSAEKTMGSITQAMTNFKDAINTLFFGGLKSLSGLIDFVNTLSTKILELSKNEGSVFRILSENLGLIALLLITAGNLLKPFAGLISYLNFAIFTLQNNITSLNSSMLTLQHVENLINSATSELVNELKLSNKELQLFKENVLTNIRLITNPNFLNFSILAQSLSVNMLKVANLLFKHIKEITYGTLAIVGITYISAIINSYRKNAEKFEAEIKKALQPIKLEAEIEVNLAESVLKTNDYLKDINEQIEKLIEKYNILNVLADKLNLTTEELVKKLILQNKELDIKDYLKNIQELSGVMNLRFNVEGLGTYKSTLNEILNTQTLISKEIDKQNNYMNLFRKMLSTILAIFENIIIRKFNLRFILPTAQEIAYLGKLNTYLIGFKLYPSNAYVLKFLGSLEAEKIQAEKRLVSFILKTKQILNTEVLEDFLKNFVSKNNFQSLSNVFKNLSGPLTNVLMNVFKTSFKILGNFFGILFNDLILTGLLAWIAPTSLAKQKAILSSWAINIGVFIYETLSNIITKAFESIIYTITNIFNKDFWSNLFKNVSEGWEKFKIGIDKFLVSDTEIIKNIINQGIGISDDKLQKWQELVNLTKEFTESLKDVSLNELFNEIDKFAEKIKSLKLKGYFTFYPDTTELQENFKGLFERYGISFPLDTFLTTLTDYLNKPIQQIANTSAEQFLEAYFSFSKNFDKMKQHLTEPLQAIFNSYKTAYDAISGVLINLITILEQTKNKIKDLSEDIIYNSNIFAKFYDDIFKEFTKKPKSLSQLIISAFNELTNKFDVLVNNYKGAIDIIEFFVEKYKFSLEQLKNLTANQLKDFVEKLPKELQTYSSKNLENISYIIDELTNFSDKFGEKLKDISSEISKYIQNSANLIAVYPNYFNDILNQIETSIEDTLTKLYEKYKDNPLLVKIIVGNISLIRKKLREFREETDFTKTFTTQLNQLKDFTTNAKNAYELYTQISKISDKTQLLYNLGEKIGITDFSKYLTTTFKEYTYSVLDGMVYKTITAKKAFVELTDKGQEFITEVLNNINKPMEIYSNYINYILNLDKDRLEKLKELEAIEQQILNDTKLQKFQKEELLETIKKQKRELLMINKLEEGIKDLIKQTLSEGFDFSILREKFGQFFNDIIQEVKIDKMIDNLNKAFENVKSSLITSVKNLYKNTDTLLLNFYRLPQILEKDIKSMLDKYKIKVDEAGLKKLINEVGSDLKEKILDAIEKSKNIIQSFKERLSLGEEDEIKSQVEELGKTLGLSVIEKQNLVSQLQQYETLKAQYQEALRNNDMFLANMLKNQLDFLRKNIENVLGGYSYKLEEMQKTAEQMFSDSVNSFSTAVNTFNQAVNTFASIMSKGISVGGGTTNTNNNQQTNTQTNNAPSNTQQFTYNPFKQGILIDPASIPYIA